MNRSSTMSRNSLELQGCPEQLEPGQDFSFDVCWQLREPSPGLVLELFWRTNGAGEEDSAVAHTLRVDLPSLSGSRSVDLTAPRSPTASPAR